jgi:DNA-binding transcriptional LysR family regulator
LDRIDAMRVFVTALDGGSLAAAARSLHRSPAAVTRAIAALERHVGVPLLYRTTRSIRLTDAGARYADTCRRVLLDLEEADLLAAGERSTPRGLLSITAPVVAGTLLLMPVLNAFLDSQPTVQARLILLDRTVNLVEEGFDVALRIAHLPDSSLIAVRVGTVRRVVCAAPDYLAGKPRIASPADLAVHDAIALTQFPQGDLWDFPVEAEGRKPRHVRVPSRLTVNSVEAAVKSSVEGYGVTRLLSYQVAEEVRLGRLVILLENAEPPPLPVHLIVPEGRLAAAKVRAFVDFAVPRLKAKFT